MRSQLLTLLAIFCLGSTVVAQEVPVGQWRDHLPYREAIAVAATPDYAYAATPFSLFRFHKQDRSIERITKIWGLSDVGVSALRYHEPTNTVLIGYSNGNLDLIINDEQLLNISAIKISNVLGDKIVNRIYFRGNFAYLACGFGIVVVDMVRHEIRETYFIGDDGALVHCTDITDDGSQLWVSTQEGIYTASLSHPNLANFNAWTKDANTPLPGASFDEIEFFSGQLLVNYPGVVERNDSLYSWNGTDWRIITEIGEWSHHSVEAHGDQIVLCLDDNIVTYDSGWNEVQRIFDYPGDVNLSPREAVIDEAGTYWIADKGSGLVESLNPFASQLISPGGPWSNAAYYVRTWGDRVMVSAGGVTQGWANLNNRDGISTLEDGEWTTINSSTDQRFKDELVRDIVSIAVDPLNPERYWASSLGLGVVEFENGAITTVYDSANSSLLPADGSTSTFTFVGAAGMETDINGNLWVASRGNTRALHVREANGNWTGFELAGTLSDGTPSQLIINQLNQKWIPLTSGGILVYDDNFTPNNPNDDQARVLGTGTGSGGLPSNSVFAVAEGLEGEIWVGTDKGIAVFFNPGNVFTNFDFDAQQILVTQDGFTGFLLETEVVTSIAIDGANRKWIGTDGAGVFLLSADGTEQVHHFTEDNSPLLSNTISHIAINQQTGEVFFATTKGLIGYKSTATAGSQTFDNIFAYPNPVEPGYMGDIAIRGLVANSDVKITDVNGNLVYEGIADGGQAVWNGRNLNGEDVRTGVYLVFCADTNGKERAVTKVLVIR